MLYMENYRNYSDNQKSRFCMKSMDLTGKYHFKIISFMKLWNDPTVGTVILPVALCLKHTRKSHMGKHM